MYMNIYMKRSHKTIKMTLVAEFVRAQRDFSNCPRQYFAIAKGKILP